MRSSVVRLLIPVALAAASLGTRCNDEPKATLIFRYQAAGAWADPSLFRLAFSQPDRRFEFDGSDLHTRMRSQNQYVGDFTLTNVRAGDNATVSIALVASADTLGRGTVTWRAERDWTYSVTGWVGATRPVGPCFQVRSATPLPARGGTTGDTLFVLYTELPYGAVC